MKQLVVEEWEMAGEAGAGVVEHDYGALLE
jgi:hypothetical protein